MTRIRQAVILVGGKGTRLGSLTQATPKPLLEIEPGITFLDFLIEEVARQGFDDILLLAGHLGEQVVAGFDGRSIGGAHVRVRVEAAPRGTGGALVEAKAVLAPHFVLMNGDSFLDANLRAFAQAPRAPGEAAMLLRRVEDAARYGRVELSGDRITAFREKSADATGPALINGGIYALDSVILEHIAALPCSLETDVFPRLVAARAMRGHVAAGYFIDIGLPDSLAQGRRELPPLRRRKTVFLDRDGVLNQDLHYVHRPDQVIWVEGARAAVRWLNDAGYRVIVVTNQAGVAHGHYAESAIGVLHAWMREELAQDGAFIDAFYYSPTHPEGRVARYRMDHEDRKPGAGMLLRAMRDWAVEKNGSFLIGDKHSDIEAANAAGLPGFLFEGGDMSRFVEACLVRMKDTAQSGNAP